MQTQILIEKINNLPPEKIYEVENFVDFLQEKLKREAKETRFRDISNYAEQHAESDADLDNELESASVEFLTEAEKE
ncbi:MAG: DUF2281 domain-containing protein [Pyrinomonadaceae bacterium]|nr:DUF2281 domain-containing protein [Acidobacteriota bacterium]